MFNHILLQVVAKVKKKKSWFGFYAIQLDETAKIANIPKLCAYLRYINEDHLEEKFLLCKSLHSRTLDFKIFKK